ncbi:MAG: zinc-dependent metalloprotease [Chitinophagales bacterium]
MKVFKCILLVAVATALFEPAFAKKDKKKKQDDIVKTVVDSSKTAKDTTAKKEGKPQFKTIKEVTEKCKKMAGLFPVYQDTTTGKIYIEISEDKLGNEFIYFATVIDGVLDAGFARGGYKDNSVFKIEKYFDRIDFKLQNTNFYFDKNTELSKAENANINQPLFYSEKIAASSVDNTTKKRSYLIDADNLFLAEQFTQVKPTRLPTDKPDAFALGTLSTKKSKYLAIKNFPNNTDVSVEYIYENPTPINGGTDEVTDPRFVSVKMQHSMIEMPKNNFKPRADDPRVGYFIEKITDQTSTSATPWKDLIHKWNLEKQDSSAKLSYPKKPIVWWIEKTTPKEFRPIIKAAVLSWNKAFEQAGFKGAVECYEQADTATWEAEDIRYNVLRWTSSPRPPYGGYGPTFVNPRTGEILGADIMLEFVYLTNRVNLEKLYDVAGLDQFSDDNKLNYANCSYGEAMHESFLSGMQFLNAFAFSALDKDEFMKQALMDLVMHEVGHTFGLNHNFIGSQMNTKEQMQDKAYCEKNGLTSSVMDYTIPNISADKNKQGLYFDNQPGVYDKWAIQYGYAQFENEQKEAEATKQLLALSNDPKYRFMNDGDDMRSPGKGINPQANLFDMSSDAVGYALDNIQMVNDALPKLLTKYGTSNQSYGELRNAYFILSGHYGRSLNVISRYLGGVYINRNFVGQDTLKPYTPVPLAEQKRAMAALNKYAFSKNAFAVPENIYAYLQQQRRGFDTRKENEDPKIHDRILNIQKAVFDQILHPLVLQRVSDSKFYGNKYSLNAMLADITDAVFTEDLSGSVNTIRQNLQEEYVNRLLSIADTRSTYSHITKSAAFGEVTKILSMMKANAGTDISTQYHRKHLAYLINKSLELK